MRQNSALRLTLWWFLFTALCIWIHSFISGIDCFGPAVLVLMHLKRYREAIWLTPMWILINEGAGSLAFGSSLLWFAGLILLFLFLCLFLSSSNLLFLFSLSLMAGTLQTGIIALMAALQEITIPFERIVVQGILTALLFPVFWFAMLFAFQRWGRTRHVSV